MESTVPLNISVTIEPGTTVYKFNEREHVIEPLEVLETHIVKVPWMDEYGNPSYKSCLDKNCSLQPNYVELVMVKSRYNGKAEPELIAVEHIWLTPEEAMDAYSKERLSHFNKKIKK